MTRTDQDGPALLRGADRVLSVIENTANLIAAFAIFFLMFVGVVQIVGRTVFDWAIHGYIDWIEQASALFAFLGISYAQRLGGHIRMDITLNWPTRVRWWIELFGVVVALVIVTLLVDSSFGNFLRAYRIGDSSMDIRLPVWPAKLMIPLALSILWCRLVLQVWGYARMVMDNDRIPIAVPRLETIDDQVRSEIEEVLGRGELADRR